MWDSDYSTNELSCFVKALPAQKVGQISMPAIDSIDGAAWQARFHGPLPTGCHSEAQTRLSHLAEGGSGMAGQPVHCHQ